MFAYIIRRILYAFPILLGVNVITFALFFMVNKPDDMARMHLGMKHVQQTDIDKWKQNHGYDKPLLYNSNPETGNHLTETIF
ncbi:MAG: ABC transporter permease, partial [Candidatus Electrothrix sp. AR3]|nr:ABC transporter permease [Candidatus Electrothrix sp. AR3]